MKRITILFLLALSPSIGFCQKSTIKKSDITPKETDKIGGISYYNNHLYLLLPTNIRFEGKIIQASESKNVSQKYLVWDVYQYDPETSKLENKSKQWKTPDASPSGFCIVNDSTVIYISKQLKLETNNLKLKSQLIPINKLNANFTDPFIDMSMKRIYFSSDLNKGKGKMDIWHFDLTSSDQVYPVNIGKLNTSSDEICPSVLNDSIMIFSSDRKNNNYNICFYNLKNDKLIHQEETSGENEFFTQLAPKGTLFYATSQKDKNTLWKGTWSMYSFDTLKTISAEGIEQIPFKVEKQPDDELVLKEGYDYQKKDISLTNYFGLAKYDLTPLMQDSLNKVSKMLKENPEINIIICGHASPDGPENLNMMLSYYRANEAYYWLINKNINPKRIFRVFGGEYLYTDTIKARMFSIFTTKTIDFPDKVVVYPVSSNENKNDLIKQYNTDTEEMDYIRLELKIFLPVEGKNILLLPIKDIQFDKEKVIYIPHHNF